jgi:4a-hydroxytetrahydrobiopterin dehydratase
MNTSSDLADGKCEPCRVGTTPLKGGDLEQLRQRLGPGWTVAEEHHLEKTYFFKDFRGALAFTNRVGELAENQGHHPDIYLAWGKVQLKIWTHKVNGLTASDFVLAAKADQLAV